MIVLGADTHKRSHTIAAVGDACTVTVGAEDCAVASPAPTAPSARSAPAPATRALVTRSSIPTSP